MQTGTPANQNRKRKQKHTFTIFSKNISTQPSTIQKNHQTKEKQYTLKITVNKQLQYQIKLHKEKETKQTTLLIYRLS